MGREAPNTNPHLPEPEGRMKFSLLHPLDFLRDCLGDNFCNKVNAPTGPGGQVVFVLIVFIFIFMQPQVHSHRSTICQVFAYFALIVGWCGSLLGHVFACACWCWCAVRSVDPAHLFERVGQRLVLPRPHDHVATGGQLGDGQVKPRICIHPPVM